MQHLGKLCICIESDSTILYGKQILDVDPPVEGTGIRFLQSIPNTPFRFVIRECVPPIFCVGGLRQPLYEHEREVLLFLDFGLSYPFLLSLNTLVLLVLFHP